jgi:hypothetical protein
MNYLRKTIKKIFYIPTPKALPIEDFSEPGEYTWEKWREESKKKYPIRYFFSETLTHWCAVNVYMPLEEKWYWLVSHTIRRYHLLDLRQPKTKELLHDNYRWGWIDEDRKLLYACFNILVNFVNSRNSSEYHYHVTPEDILKLRESEEAAKQINAEQADSLQEIYNLYKYWTVDRKIDQKEIDDAMKGWHDNRKNDKASNNTARWDKLRELEEKFYKKEEDALIRLIKVRGAMWT